MSSEIFEKNLAAMDKWYPVFADLIRNEKYEKDDTEVITEESLDGVSIFKIKQSDRTLYLNGKRNAAAPVRTWMEILGEIHKHAPVFLMGLGNGSYLKALVDGTDESVKVIAYEPSVSIFIRMLEETDISAQIENRPLAFIVKGININELVPVVDKLMSLENMEYMKLAVHPNYRELFPDDIHAAVKIVHRSYGNILSNMNTGVSFSQVLAVNQMQNMRYVCDGYNTKGISRVLPYENRAGIVVSAGPSLNKNIHELKKAKNKAFILAVDTALKPLFKAGIVPDAFIMIDAKKPLSLFDMDGIRDVPLIAPVDANYEVIRRQRGLKIFFNITNALPTRTYMTAGKVFPSLPCGGSVATSAFGLLYRCGFETIIFVGQDLALTGNKTHADGTFEEHMPEEDTSRMRMVRGNYEEHVPTREDFKIFLDWFEAYIDGAKKHDGNLRVINATEGGAYIGGTEIMTLKEAIEQTCDVEEVDFGECLANIEPDLTGESREKAIEFLHAIPDNFNVIYNDAKKLYTAYHKINSMNKSGNINNQEYARQLKKVHKLTAKCYGNPAYPIIASTMGVADSIIRGGILNDYEDSYDEIDELSRQGMKYAKLIQQCTQIFEDYARETLLSIE